MNRLVKYVPDTNMGKGYTALNELVSLQKLGKGEFVAFVNKKRDKVKLCTGNDVLAYLRLPKGKIIDPRTIQLLPQYFNGQEIDYDKAIERVLRAQFPQWFEKKDK